MSVSSNEIGELLIDLGLIDSQQLVDAISIQQISGHRLTVVLAEMGLVSERQLKDALELQFGVNFVTLSKAPPEETVVRSVPEDIERKFRFVPIAKSGTQHTVAMVDPDDANAAEMIRLHLGTNNFKKLVCTADDFDHLMREIYEKVEQPVASEASIEEEPVIAEMRPKSASPKASQTKLKSHMRNLFGADSDDDLDDMFGGASGDSIDAVSQAEINDGIESEAATQITESEPVSKAPAKKSGKKKAKSFTSLFDEDDEDDVFGDKKQDAEPAETSVESTPSSETTPVEEELAPVTKLKKGAKKNAKAEQEAPQNQLLEHILKEADTQPKPAKKVKNKKSMASLFGDDDDDDDMSFGDEAQTASGDQEPVSLQPNELDQEPADGNEDSLSALLAESNLHETVSEAESSASSPSTSKNKSFRSLFDDDDDLGLGGDDDEEPVSEPVVDTGADTEVEVEAVPDEEPAQAPEVEQEQDAELELQPEVEPDVDTEPVSESLSELLSEPEQEPEPLAEAEPSSAPAKKSLASKQFRSLFDDDVEEDDLFGNDPVSLVENLTSAPLVADEPPVENEPPVEEEPPQMVAEVEAEIDRSGEYSTESLMNAIDRPFQSLFDDEDDDEIFGSSEASTESEKTTEVLKAEPQESLSESPGYSLEPEFGNELLTEPLTSDAPEELEFEEVPLAYNASFDDDMDEDSLFASASHPIPEGAPQLRDLLSRFDEDDADEESTPETLKGPSFVAETAVPEPVKKDAELAVSALLAALDEQVPDEPIRNEPLKASEPSKEVEKPKAAEPVHAELEPGEQFSADRIIAELEAEEAPAMFSKLEDEPVVPTVPEQEEEPQSELALEPEAEPQIEFVPEPEPELDSTSDQEPAAASPVVAEEPTAPVVQDAAAAAAEPISSPTPAPKPRRLRALMSDLDDEDEFASLGTKESDSKQEDAPPVVAENQEPAESKGLRELLTAGRADFEELPLENEVLSDTYGSSTTDLPPVFVSHEAINPESISATVPVESAPEPASEPVSLDTSSQIDDYEPAPAETFRPKNRLRALTSLPEQSAEVPIVSASEPPPGYKSELPPLPATAAELPDALEEVLASVTFEMMDNVDLANLSGNRTEISFLEEIVESELALTEEPWDKNAAPATVSPVEPAAIESKPQVVPQPAVKQPAAQPPAAQPAASDSKPAPEHHLAPTLGPEDLDPSILNLATQILTQAVSSPCSDVHFEPLADGLALRFMFEGELLDETILPAQIQVMLILCLKSMAGLDTKITDRPQDKKFVTRNFGDPVEMRITSIPGVHGEMVAVSLKT